MNTEAPASIRNTEAPGAKSATDEVLARAQAVLGRCNAVQIATAGGPMSPWVLGAYFAHDGPDLLVFLESHGKSAANLQVSERVAFVVSENDASLDFLQGHGRARRLDDAESEGVRARLVSKMPWFKTYTPVTPYRIEADELFVSSFAAGWFPARVWKRAG